MEVHNFWESRKGTFFSLGIDLLLWWVVVGGGALWEQDLSQVCAREMVKAYVFTKYHLPPPLLSFQKRLAEKINLHSVGGEGKRVRRFGAAL